MDLYVASQKKSKYMNTKKISGWMIATIVATMMLSSCTKDDEQNVTDISEQSLFIQTKSSSSVSYYSTPDIEGYVPDSELGMVIGEVGGCGSHTGGYLRAQVVDYYMDQFRIHVSKQDGSYFTPSTEVYLKKAIPCGDILNDMFAYPGVNISAFGMPVAPDFQQGVMHIYPTAINGSNRWFAEPILIYTSPMYNKKQSYTNGEVLGTVNGVEVYANGSTNQGTGTYQCVEFCKRYYSQVYGKTLGSMGYAYEWFGKGLDKGLIPHDNGGNAAPRPGDILCMSGGTGGKGHVAIIIEVTSTFIKIAQQNSGNPSSETRWSAPIGGKLDRSGNWITFPDGYEIQGWLRMP
jgi:surface antigen